MKGSFTTQTIFRFPEATSSYNSASSNIFGPDAFFNVHREPRCQVLKCLVFCLSSTFIVIGLMLVIGAIYTKQNFTGGPELHWAIWMSMLAGGMLVLIGFAACCGVSMNSFCVILFATAFLAMLCAIFLAATLLIHDELRYAVTEVGGALKVAMQMYDPEDYVTTADLDAYQRQFKCCGADSPADWLAVPLRAIPDSCPHPLTMLQGCTPIITSYVEATTYYVIAALGSLTGYLFLGLVAISFLAWITHKSKL